MRRAVILACAVGTIMLGCLFLPVMEASRCASLEWRIDEGNERISSLMDSIRGRTARIAQSSSSEFLVWSSGNLGLGLRKIEPDKNYFVQEGMEE